MRYEQTLKHTDSSSMRIYYIDGGVLALISFTFAVLGISRQAVLLMAIPVTVLALINLLHSEFIRIQHRWINHIDARLLELLEESDKSLSRLTSRVRPSSAHGVYRTIHLTISIGLAALAIFMIAYGLGYVPEFAVL